MTSEGHRTRMHCVGRFNENFAEGGGTVQGGTIHINIPDGLSQTQGAPLYRVA